MTDTGQAADLLEELIAFAAGVRPLSARGRRWLLAGVQRYLMTRAPLEKCLGLTAESLPKARTSLLRAKRNAYLRTAWLAIPREDPWPRSCALAAEVGRFESRIWPRYKMYEAPPADWSKLRSALFHAFKLGALLHAPDVDVPRSVSGLHKAVTGRGDGGSGKG